MSAPLREHSLLLVEDNPGDARLIAELLRGSASTVTLTSVTTLADALDAIAYEPPDAVILDLGLPDSDGIETLTKLQQVAPGVAIIIMSGNSDPRTAMLTVQGGAQDFLVKGRVDGDMLVRSVGYAIERKSAERSLLASDEQLRRNIEVNRSIAEVSRLLVAEVMPIDQIAELARSYAQQLTASAHGFVSHIDPATGDNVMLATSHMGPDGPAAAPAKSPIKAFPPGQDGVFPNLWGVCLNTGRSFFTNAPADHEASGGAPLGHAPIENLLCVPVTTSAGVVGQIAVANKPGGYTPADVDTVERLAALYAVAVIRHQADDALRRSEAELRTSNAQLAAMIHDVAETMGGVVEARDPYTQGHQVRVAKVACLLATEMGLSTDEIACIEMAGLLHDIGKMSVPTEILSKPGDLSSIEFALIKEHPALGAVILAKITFPWPIADIVRQHHERCDGSGYPDGLKRAQTLPQARILAVADVLEAMSSFRPYREALGVEAAIAEVTGRVGKYDPEVVAAAVALNERSELGL